MNRNAALRRFAPFVNSLAALAGGFLLFAATPQLSAQSPSLAFATAQILPATQTGAFNYDAVAVDNAGNRFVVNSVLGTVEEIPAGSSQLAPVHVKGVSNPLGIAVDPAGNLYIANDSALPDGQSTSSIIKLTPGGAQSTVGTGWESPQAIAVDAAGDIFVVDEYLTSSGGSTTPHPAIYKVPVSTGVRTMLPFTGLNAPLGIAVDPKGNVYVADQGAGKVQVLEAAAAPQVSTTLVSAVHPWGIATDLAGNVFFVDYNAQAVREFPAGSIPGDNSALITAYSMRLSDSDPAPDPYVGPIENLAVDANGDLFFNAVNGNNESYFIAEVQRTSVNFGPMDVCVAGWNTLPECSEALTLWLNPAGTATPGVQLLSGGVASSDFKASFAVNECDVQDLGAGSGCPLQVVFSPKFSGPRSAVLQLLDGDGKVQSSTLLYGVGVGPQVTFGPVSQSVLGTQQVKVEQIAVDGAGNVYAAQQKNGGNVVEYPAAGGAPINITPSSRIFPAGVAVDGLGNTYLLDTGGRQLVKLAPNGTQTTVATGLSSPAGVAVDNAGNAYIADSGNQRVLKVSGLGNVETTLLGNQAVHKPQAVAVDSQGDVFAIDSAERTVVEWTAATGAISTVASGFERPCSLAVDAAGDLYVSDFDAGTVTEFPANGGAKFTVGTGLRYPCGVALDGGGNVFIANSGTNGVIKVGRSQAPSFSFAATQVGSRSSDSPKSIQIANVGNAPLVGAGGLSNGANFAEVANSASGPDCTEVFWLDPGAACSVSFAFSPTEAGPLTSVDLLAFNANPDSVLIQLSGTGTDTPVSILPVGGTGQTAVYGSGFSNPLAVLVQDASGAGVANVTVTFAGTGVGFASKTVVTNASGYATVISTAIGFGNLTATASIAGVSTPASFAEAGTKATLTVTPARVAWDQGQPFTLNSYSIAGLVNGDTVTGAPRLTTTATRTSPVGNYPITASQGTLVVPSDYTVVFAPGSLLIDTPASIFIQRGGGQSSVQGTAFANPVVAVVLGMSNLYLNGVPVAFSSSQMAFSTPTVTTGYVASLQCTCVGVTATPTAVGALTGTATIEGTALGASFSETGLPGPPATVSVVSGNGQSAVQGAAFASPLTVKVTDASGNPVPNVTVNFSGVGLSLSTATATTNASGVASDTAVAESFGPLTAIATVKGVLSPALFQETGTLSGLLDQPRLGKL